MSMLKSQLNLIKPFPSFIPLNPSLRKLPQCCLSTLHLKDLMESGTAVQLSSSRYKGLGMGTRADLPTFQSSLSASARALKSSADYGNCLLPKSIELRSAKLRDQCTTTETGRYCTTVIHLLHDDTPLLKPPRQVY